VTSTTQDGALRLHAGLFDNGTLFGSLAGDISSVSLRSAGQRHSARGGNPVQDVVFGQRIIDRGVEFGHDLGRVPADATSHLLRPECRSLKLPGTASVGYEMSALDHKTPGWQGFFHERRLGRHGHGFDP
jgi:hypothetical protein